MTSQYETIKPDRSKSAKIEIIYHLIYTWCKSNNIHDMRFWDNYFRATTAKFFVENFDSYDFFSIYDDDEGKELCIMMQHYNENQPFGLFSDAGKKNSIPRIAVHILPITKDFKSFNEKIMHIYPNTSKQEYLKIFDEIKRFLMRE